MLFQSPFVPARWALGTPDQPITANVFPTLPGQLFIVKKSPIWSTKVSTAASGRERRVQYWLYPRWQFTIDFEFLRNDQLPYTELFQILAFFNAQAGQFSEWFYFDPTDNAVVNQPIGTGNGTTTAFQLGRSLGSNASGSPLFEPIYATTGTPKLYVANAQVSYTAGTYGMVTLASAPASGSVVSWTGNFMYRCRFDTDQTDAGQMFSTIWDLKGLTFKSIKP